jgi:hypothetical protein
MPNCMFPLAELHVHSHGSSGRWLLPTTIRLSESMSRKSSGWLPSAPAVSPHLSLFNLLSDQHINTLGSISVRVGPRIAVLEFLVIRTPGDTTKNSLVELLLLRRCRHLDRDLQWHRSHINYIGDSRILIVGGPQGQL